MAGVNEDKNSKKNLTVLQNPGTGFIDYFPFP
jgi:hypothetical protein